MKDNCLIDQAMKKYNYKHFTVYNETPNYCITK